MHIDDGVPSSTRNDKKSLNVSDNGLTRILQLFDGLPYRFSSVLLSLFLLDRVFSFPENGYGSGAFVTTCNKNRAVHLMHPANSFNRYNSHFVARV